MYEKEAEKNFDLLKKLLKDLCLIPAPSHFEDERASYILKFVKDNGFKDAYVDSAKNVVWKIEGESPRAIMFTAHTDTVFPDTTPMPFIEDGEFYRCPGVCDDTGALVPLIVASIDLLKKGKPKHTIIFSANSCEEGLGNLDGCKQLMKDFEDVLDKMYAFDANIDKLYNKVVGSVRYKVSVKCKGGHSFYRFGDANAIAVISEIINRIYKIKVPKAKNEKTTYNVGVISGGTSVNTVSQNAEMLCEYRSTSQKHLSVMQKKFEKIFNSSYNGACVEYEIVGSRPCANAVDEKIIAEMTEIALTAQSRYSLVTVGCASTDCNIPLSKGIPAICVGAFQGGGEHTKEEWMKISGLKKGYQIIREVVERNF